MMNYNFLMNSDHIFATVHSHKDGQTFPIKSAADSYIYK